MASTTTCSHCGELIDPDGYRIVQTETHTAADGTTWDQTSSYHEDCAAEYPEAERRGTWERA